MQLQGFPRGRAQTGDQGLDEAAGARVVTRCGSATNRVSVSGGVSSTRCGSKY